MMRLRIAANMFFSGKQEIKAFCGAKLSVLATQECSGKFLPLEEYKFFHIISREIKILACDKRR